MRRKTQWALGGVLAGTVLLGAGTTLATFTDRAEVGASTGAASLALQLAPASPTGQPLQVHAQDAGGTALEVAASGEVTGHLRLSLPGVACADLPDVALTVTGLGAGAPTTTLCRLASGAVDLGVLPAAAATSISLHVARAPGSTQFRAGVSWTGDLTFVLAQDASGAGLSDARTVRVHLVVPGGPADPVQPPAQGGGQTGNAGGDAGGGQPGNAGGGQGGGQPGGGQGGDQGGGQRGNAGGSDGR